MRRITIPEIAQRLKQAILARAEALPVARNLLLSRDSNRGVAGSAPQFDGLAILFSGAAPGTLPDDAERLLRRRFDLLGLRDLNFGTPIDWHLEPISGKASPRIPWKQLDNLDASLTGDKKVVWELNRHQFLVRLAQAFQSSREERYAHAVIDHISSWMRENPAGIGINWVSSLELAFRAISWLWALSLIRNARCWSELPALEVANALHDHALHIERHLSTYSSPNTHLTGEALGLYYIGSCVGELRNAARWRNLGRRILLEQLDVQVRPDGVYFEQSSWYHRYTVDFYTHFLLLAGRTQDHLPERVASRLESLCEHLMWISRPDGSFPLIGDDDGGKLLKLDALPASDWRAALCNASVIFGRGDFKYVAGALAEETQWLFGAAARSRYAAIASAVPQGLSRAFMNGGYFVMRSAWTSHAHFALIDCGPHGVMNCGHAHADALSLELTACGTPTLVDPGTFAYTASASDRDLFRSTAMHNTMTVDGASSSLSAGPFKWDHVAQSRLECWLNHTRFTLFQGSHDGYRRLADPVEHRRAVFFPARAYWAVLDQAIAVAKHDYDLHFHFNVDTAIECSVAEAGLVSTLRAVRLDVINQPLQGGWELTSSPVSACYAQQQSAPHAVFRVKQTGSVNILTVLYPRSVDVEAPAVRWFDLPSGKGLALTTASHADLLLWRSGAVEVEGVVRLDFEWLWLRRSSQNGAIEQIVLTQGSEVAMADFALVAESPLEYVSAVVLGSTLTLDLSNPVTFKLRVPKGVDKVVVNGVAEHVGFDAQLSFSAARVMPLKTSADRQECFSHVRH